MKEIAERVVQIIDNSGIDKKTFAEKLGVSAAVLSHIDSGRNNPSLEIILSILKEFPEISPDWLLLGKGAYKRVEMDEKSNSDVINERIRLLKMILTEHYRSEMNLLDEIIPKKN